MRLRARAASVGVVLGLLLALPVGSAGADKVTLRLDWILTGKHLPFYLALERGYYEAENLQIEIFQGQGSATTVKLVGNKSDTFGYADASVVAVGVSIGTPMKMVGGIARRSAVAIGYWADSGITTPKSLEGKSLLVTPGTTESTILPALFAINQVDPQKVSLINVAASAKIQAFLQKQADGMVGVSNSDILVAAKENPAVKSMLFADYGVNLVAHGLITHNDTIRSQPDLVRRFLRASRKGWAEAQKAPDDAVAAGLRRFPQSKPDVLKEQLVTGFEQLDSNRTKGKPLLWQSREDWEDTLAILAKYGGLKDPKPIQEYFTNDLLPE